MAHLNEVCAKDGGFLGVVEQGADFGFGGRGHAILEDGGDGVDIAIVVGYCSWRSGALSGRVGVLERKKWLPTWMRALTSDI